MPTEHGRELDAAIAREVMGLEVKMSQVRQGVLLAKVSTFNPTPIWILAPEYSSDANAARLVLAEIERRGLMREFVGCFYDINPSLEPTEFWTYTDAWACLNATPEAICLAALTAVRGGKP